MDPRAAATHWYCMRASRDAHGETAGPSRRHRDRARRRRASSGTRTRLVDLLGRPTSDESLRAVQPQEGRPLVAGGQVRFVARPVSAAQCLLRSACCANEAANGDSARRWSAGLCTRGGLARHPITSQVEKRLLNPIDRRRWHLTVVFGIIGPLFQVPLEHRAHLTSWLKHD